MLREITHILITDVAQFDRSDNQPAVFSIIYRSFCLYSLQEKFAGVDIRVRVNGGGHVAQIYAIRQSISKALVSFYQKCKYFAQLSE